MPSLQMVSGGIAATTLAGSSDFLLHLGSPLVIQSIYLCPAFWIRVNHHSVTDWADPRSPIVWLTWCDSLDSPSASQHNYLPGWWLLASRLPSLTTCANPLLIILKPNWWAGPTQVAKSKWVTGMPNPQTGCYVYSKGTFSPTATLAAVTAIWKHLRRFTLLSIKSQK